MPVFKRRSISARLFRLVVRGSLFLSSNAYGQSFSAFSTAPGQYTSATLGGHSRPKAVVVDHFFVRRLKCSFHSLLTLKIQVWQYNKKLRFVKNINPRTKKPPQKDVGFLLRCGAPPNGWVYFDYIRCRNGITHLPLSLYVGYRVAPRESCKGRDTSSDSPGTRGV